MSNIHIRTSPFHPGKWLHTERQNTARILVFKTGILVHTLHLCQLLTIGIQDSILQVGFASIGNREKDIRILGISFTIFVSRLGRRHEQAFVAIDHSESLNHILTIQRHGGNCLYSVTGNHPVNSRFDFHSFTAFLYVCTVKSKKIPLQPVENHQPQGD